MEVFSLKLYSLVRLEEITYEIPKKAPGGITNGTSLGILDETPERNFPMTPQKEFLEEFQDEFIGSKLSFG